MSGAVGVKQPAFDQMVARFTAACGQVEQCAQALQWELSQAQLPVGPATRLRGMAGRMRAEASDLRRRQAILQHLQATTAYVPQWTPTGTLWDLPDDIRALQAGMDGGKAAELAKKAAQGDAKALSQLQKYGAQAGDPNFAKALLLGLGAKGVIELYLLPGSAPAIRRVVAPRGTGCGFHRAADHGSGGLAAWFPTT
ncbi:hypothetical protein, partial [Streptomyces cuspidosporus]|uniref:hypothetical protein n=1 Tax=Streptomyces cuspidosporus TaxID=66882 RepID=UPI0031FD38FF